MRKTLFVTAAAAAVLVTAPFSASAASGGKSTAPKLDAFSCVSDGAIYGPCSLTQPGTSGWVKNDAPGDHDGYSLAVTTGANQADAVSYAGANVLNTSVTGEHLAQITALSFDTTGFQGGGAPRISLGLSDGSYIYLDPEYCETAIGTSGWYHADFRDQANLSGYGTGAAPSCTIYTTFGVFSAHDGYTAYNWMNAAAVSNGNPTVSTITFVQDWGPGTSYNDNLTFDGTTFTAPPGKSK